MSNLIITTKKPFKNLCGGTRRLNAIIEGIKTIHPDKVLKIIVLSIGFQSKINLNNENGVKVITYQIPISRVMTNIVFSLMRGESIQGRLWFDENLSKLKNLNANFEHDKIIFHHIRTYRYCGILKGQKKYLDMVDLMSAAMKARNVKTQDKNLFQWIALKIIGVVTNYEENMLSIEETEVIKNFDRVLLVSNRDIKKLCQKLVKKDVEKIQLSPLVEEPDLHACRDNSFLRAKLKNGVTQIAFHGDFNYPPNKEAANFVTNKIIPELLLRRQDSIKFNFIGNGSERYSHIYKKDQFSIEVYGSGWASSLSDALLPNSIVIVPIQSGAGVQNKIIDGLQLGIPVLASRFSADALPYSLASLLWIAEDVSDFADQILHIIDEYNNIKASEIIENFRRAQIECERTFFNSIQ